MGKVVNVFEVELICFGGSSSLARRLEPLAALCRSHGCASGALASARDATVQTDFPFSSLGASSALLRWILAQRIA